MEKVEVISSSLVKMATMTSNSISRLELTPWDLKVILLDPIQKGILFHNPKSQQIDDSFINHLKRSFSRTLEFFPPLAGRLATTGNDTTCFFVDCNNAGAVFTHAVASTVSISDVLTPTYVPEIVSSFFPLDTGICNYEGTSKPLMAVQVTELVDGVFIGVTANHVVVDGASFWHFFESWSEISRGLDTISKVPLFERLYSGSIHLPPLEDPSKDYIAPPTLERVFHFSKESLAKLKAKANSEAGVSNKISSLQALSAHLWRSSTRCRQRQYSSHGISYFLLIIGARQRISALREGYFGNATYAAYTVIPEDEASEKGLGYVALKINELVGQQSSEAAKQSLDDWMKNPVLYPKGCAYAFTISSSPRFNIYGVDFGWGKPIAPRSAKTTNLDGKITLYPAAVAGGIDVEVCMAPEILQAMGDDLEFMEAIF